MSLKDLAILGNVHAMMQLRRQQNLELLGLHETSEVRECPPPVIHPVETEPMMIVRDGHHHCSTPSEGPSSRDWLLMSMAIGGASLAMIIIGMLVLLALISTGILTPASGGGGATGLIP